MNIRDTAAIYLDIETGGIDPSKSSILSIAAGKHGSITTKFNQPIEGTFLSSFSEQNIIPQLQQAGNLSTERKSIESLIDILSKNPESPIAGYNVRGFDLGFIQRRSRIYGLENKFISAIGKREVQDPVQDVKDIIARSIKHHLNTGTFSQELGGLSWKDAQARYTDSSEASTAFKRLISVETYKIGDETSKFRGYKLEDAYSILGKSLSSGRAHEALADLEMTEEVWKAIRSGDLQNRLQRPEVARAWLGRVLERESKYSSGPGRLLSKIDLEEMNLIKKPIWKNKFAIGAGIAVAAALAINKISGKDDDYNSIEGLRHGGLSEDKRLELTEFGSGWRGIVKIPYAMEHALGKTQGMFINISSIKPEIEKMLSITRSPETISRLINKGITIEQAQRDISAAESQVLIFSKSIEEAEQAGHKRVTGISQSFLDEVKSGNRASRDLRAIIKHERVHTGAAEITGSTSGLPGIAPKSWIDYLAANNYNSGAKSTYYEELLAFTLQDKIIRKTLPNAMMALHPPGNTVDQVANYVIKQGYDFESVALKSLDVIQKAEDLEKSGQQARLSRIYQYQAKKKLAASMLQRSATKTAWEAGIDAGRRSRM